MENIEKEVVESIYRNKISEKLIFAITKTNLKAGFDGVLKTPQQIFPIVELISAMNIDILYQIVSEWPLPEECTGNYFLISSWRASMRHLKSRFNSFYETINFGCIEDLRKEDDVIVKHTIYTDPYLLINDVDKSLVRSRGVNYKMIRKCFFYSEEHVNLDIEFENPKYIRAFRGSNSSMNRDYITNKLSSLFSSNLFFDSSLFAERCISQGVSMSGLNDLVLDKIKEEEKHIWPLALTLFHEWVVP